ncbi:hypothetical protein Hanom_Chr12g01070491 [Helianthus anomalus]
MPTFEPGVLLEIASLFLRCRGKAVYILPSSDPALALLLVGFTEYDDDDVDDELEQICNYLYNLQISQSRLIASFLTWLKFVTDLCRTVEDETPVFIPGLMVRVRYACFLVFRCVEVL